MIWLPWGLILHGQKQYEFPEDWSDYTLSQFRHLIPAIAPRSKEFRRMSMSELVALIVLRGREESNRKWIWPLTNWLLASRSLATKLRMRLVVLHMASLDTTSRPSSS